MIEVKATFEGLVGKKTASGWIINTRLRYVALPSTRALERIVQVRNPANGKTTPAVVMDVGPWNEHDDGYVFNGARPQAESGVDAFGRPTNGSGIDLGEATRHALELTDNGPVEWEFI